MNYLLCLVFSLNLLISPLCFCANMRSYLNAQLSEKDRALLINNIIGSVVSNKLGNVIHDSFSYDKDCVAFQRSNVLFFEDCHLPDRCGPEYKKELDSTFYGNKLNMCYSFHKPMQGSRQIPMFEISFKKFSMSLEKPVKVIQRTLRELTEVYPVSFFEHFVYTKENGLLKMYPRYCLDSYTHTGQSTPISVDIKCGDHECCVYHMSSDTDCAPLAFNNFSELVDYFDFPIAFYYSDYVAVYTSNTGNECPDASTAYYPVTNSTGDLEWKRVDLTDRNQTEIMDRVNKRFFTLTRDHFNKLKSYTSSDDPSDPDDYKPYYIVYANPEANTTSVQEYCTSIVTNYHSPLDTIGTIVVNVFETIFSKLLKLLTECSTQIAEIVVKVLLEVFLALWNFINSKLTVEIVTISLIFIALFFYFRDFTLSIFTTIFLSYISLKFR